MHTKIAFLLLCLLWAKTIRTQAPPQNLNDFYALAARQKTQTFTLLHQYSAQTIVGRAGSRIRLPAQALVRADGTAPRLPITLRLREAYTWGDMLAQNITTTYSPQLRPLQTAGIIHIEASDAAAQPLQLAKNKRIGIGLPQPSSELPQYMQLFQGERTDSNERSPLSWQRTDTAFEMLHRPPKPCGQEQLRVPNMLLLINPQNKIIAPYDFIADFDSLAALYPQAAAYGTALYEEQAYEYSRWLKGTYALFFKCFANTESSDTVYFSYRSWREDVVDAALRLADFAHQNEVAIVSEKDRSRAAFAAIVAQEKALNEDIAHLRQFCQNADFMALVAEAKDSFEAEKHYPLLFLHGYYNGESSIEYHRERWEAAAPDSGSFVECCHRFVQQQTKPLSRAFDYDKQLRWGQRLQALGFLQKLRIAATFADRYAEIFYRYRQQKALLGELAGNYYAVAESERLGWLACMRFSSLPSPENHRYNGIYVSSLDEDTYAAVFLLMPSIASIQPLQRNGIITTMHHAPDLPVKIVFLIVKGGKIRLSIKEMSLKNLSFDAEDLREYSFDEALLLLQRL